MVYFSDLALCHAAQLDVEDIATAGSRTPYNTPPERRRENVSELGELLEALQSVGRRNSDVSTPLPITFPVSI